LLLDVSPAQPVHHAFVAVLPKRLQQALHLTYAQAQLLCRCLLRDQFLPHLLERYQPVSISLIHQ
jgi:hypothetical protein